MATIWTSRLLLRRWRQADVAPLARVNADPEVMRWIGDGRVRDTGQTRASIEAVEHGWETKGFGLFAVELRATGELMGFTGLSIPDFMPEVLPVNDWEQTLAEYGYTYLITPGSQIVPELAADLVTVRTLMSREKPASPLHRSWCRIVAGLSMLLAKALSSQQRPRDARTWWTTAQQAADTSGDLNLSLWISGEHLVHGLYERRPIPILLRRANDIAERTGDAPHRGLATVLAARAQLLALDGRTDDANEALRQTTALFSRLPSSVTAERRSLAGWGEDCLRYTEAFVHAHLGNSKQVATAVGHALDLTPRDQQRVRIQIELLHGFGLVRSGDIAEGIRHAHNALEANPDARHSLMAASIAGDVLDAVPARARREPLVVGYQELLAGDAPKSIT